MERIGVGLLGFGTVGAGVAKGLLGNRGLLAQRLGVDVELRRIADLDVETDRGVAVPPGVLTADARGVVRDPGVDIVVELIGGTGAARELVLEALNAGKAVVTANKRLLAESGGEIFDAAAAHGADIYFGASVGGGIPVIRVLREGLAGNRIESIHGILNGTCNYILTRMESGRLPFGEALEEARREGYAEADPGLDIDGLDTAHKAVILASLAYGFHVPLGDVPVEGIRSLSGIDVAYAARLGYRIKLLASIARAGEGEIEAGVHPALVPQGHMLASVNGVFNAVMIRGDLSGDTLYYGRGAGREPTASTVIGDIGDIARNLTFGRPRYARAVCTPNAGRVRVRPAGEVTSRFYARLMVRDEAGALGRIAAALGGRGISILAAAQQEQLDIGGGGGCCPGHVPVVILTHPARGADLDAALREVEATGVVGAPPVRLRVL